MAKVVEVSDPLGTWATMSWRSMLNVFLTGILVGVLTYMLYLLLERFVFEPIMCRDSVALARCESKDDFASIVALVLGSMLGLILMVRQRVYRPLLATLGIFLSFWTIFLVLMNLPWLAVLIISVLAFGIGYVLFAWLVQPVSLGLSLVMVTLAVVVIRIVLTV
ncbi:hypothetical protein RAAC3_TM7C00001G0885 [Candidatus Saccharibacteria bacterium RAAC3_TM7_1]|nr:hypothetical protein RAAC3_TM7C00001G0885 [Candidatus Saccharibacteria bacterium RAAC3_TM7_1]HCZ28861.1 hypothetical protein [Candidatus Saccharibacteria bacterium]